MGFFNLVIPTYKPTDPIIPRVIFGIPSPVHTFKHESRPDFALKSQVPTFKEGKSRIMKSHIDGVHQIKRNLALT